MADVTIRSATIFDALDLAPRLRQSDVDEIYAARGISARAGLLASIEASEDSFAGLVDGEVVAVFGVARAGGYGVPWLLASPEIERRPVAFLRRNKSFVTAMKDRYGALRNHVDARHDASIAWLKWLGFTVHGAEPWGFEGRPFHPFAME